jgi:hypothetical protein
MACLAYSEKNSNYYRFQFSLLHTDVMRKMFAKNHVPICSIQSIVRKKTKMQQKATLFPLMIPMFKFEFKYCMFGPGSFILTQVTA